MVVPLQRKPLTSTGFTQFSSLIFGVMGSIIGFAILMLHNNMKLENPCVMTYIYRNFELTPIPFNVVEDSPGGSVAEYELLLYNEGLKHFGITKKKTLSNLVANEIPVLFIPGSGGSPSQVRSLAAVMQNKTEMAGVGFRFRFFTIDFRGQFSFCNGVVLQSQQRFVFQALKHIRKLAKHQKKIVIYGHSFGGTIAMSLVNHPEYQPEWIDLIILKSAPLNMSPTLFDYQTRWFFEDIKTSWSKKKSLYENVGVVSFSGGLKDYLVPDQLTQLPKIYNRSIWSVEGLPDFGVDHLCIVWCNQFVRYVSRILFKYGQQYNNSYLNGKHVLDEFFNDEWEHLQEVAHVEEKKNRKPILLESGTKYSKINLDENGMMLFRVEIDKFEVTFVNVSSENCLKQMVMYRNYNQIHIKNLTKGDGSLAIYRIENNEKVDVMLIGEKSCQFSIETTQIQYLKLWKWYEIVFSESHYVLMSFLVCCFRLLIVELDSDSTKLLSFGFIASSVVTGFLAYASTDWIVEQGAVLAGYVFGFVYWYLMGMAIEFVSKFTYQNFEISLPPEILELGYFVVMAHAIILPTVGTACVMIALAFRNSFATSIIIVPLCLPLIFRSFYTRLPFLHSTGNFGDYLHLPLGISFIMYLIFTLTGFRFKRSPLVFLIVLTLPIEWVFRALPLELFSCLGLFALTLNRFVEPSTNTHRQIPSRHRTRSS